MGPDSSKTQSPGGSKRETKDLHLPPARESRERKQSSGKASEKASNSERREGEAVEKISERKQDDGKDFELKRESKDEKGDEKTSLKDKLKSKIQETPATLKASGKVDLQALDILVRLTVRDPSTETNSKQKGGKDTKERDRNNGRDKDEVSYPSPPSSTI